MQDLVSKRDQSWVTGDAILHTLIIPQFGKNTTCALHELFVHYKKGCTRLAAASDKVYQLLAKGRWFSPGTPASSTTKTGRHDIAEILLKVALNTKIQIQIHSPLRRGFALHFINYKRGCTRLSAASDKVYQLFAHDRWFSPGNPAFSTTKTGRHDITEILLKVTLNTKNQKSIKIKNHSLK
jgi:hypothetical protein